jgi:hypothetical protein
VVGQSLRYTCMYLCYTTLPPPQSAGTQDPCIQTLDGRVRTKHCAGVLDSPEDIPASELRCKDQFIAPRSHHPITLVDCQTSLPAGRMRNIIFKHLVPTATEIKPTRNGSTKTSPSKNPRLPPTLPLENTLPTNETKLHSNNNQQQHQG